MDPAARATAIADIQRIFAAYRAAQPKNATQMATLADGKLYELFVLSDLLIDLSNRGFTMTFVGSTLKFKASPGKIKIGDPHFKVKAPSSSRADYRIFVDIEFDTLGHSKHPVSDNSRRHELDIIMTTASSGYPAHDEIVFGVECKATANFTKSLIKEALGIRRELSLLSTARVSTLSSAGGRTKIYVAADPPSEFRLAFIDPKGTNYTDSPKVFGIELKHVQP